MKKHQALNLRLTIFLLVISLLSPLVTAQAFAEDAPESDPAAQATGTLLIKLQSEGGGLIGGGSFHVVDANGGDRWVSDGEDGSADGVTTVTGLAAGWATVYQSASPAGFIATSAELGAPVQAGGSVDLWVTNAAEVVEAPPPPPPPDDDADGVINDSDNCTWVSNPGQTDSDADGLGDACDDTPFPDNDGDGVDNNNDNCTDVANADQVDTDGDGLGDACDDTPNGDIVDTDGDGIADDLDLCPDVADADQLDTDSDGLGNACDDDDDADGLSDADEVSAGSDPLLADTDDDGVLDGVDNCVIDANKNQQDKDEDGVGDACSTSSPDGSPTADTGDPAARLIGPLATTVTAVDIDFAAPDPSTYNHNSATGLGGTYPGDEFETLNGGDFKCGEYVHYWSRITVDSGSGSLDFINGFATTTSNGDLVGFDAIGSVYIDFANSLNLEGDEAVSFTSSSGSGEVVANITVTGLDPGDVVMVRTTARLYCDTDKASGVVQARLESTLGGDQTVNLTAAGQIETPGLNITKSCLTVIGDGARIGSQVQYTVTVTNAGNTALSNVLVTDNRTGTFSPAFPTSLAAGASASSTFTTTITAADVAAGQVSNTASVSASFGETLLSDTASADCPFTAFSELTITKSCPTIAPGARVGDAIAYTVTIENTGDTAITGIVVTDSRSPNGSFDSAFPTTLAAGSDPVSRTFTSTITAADVTAGNVDNTASVDSDQTASVSDTAECPFTPVSGLTITKSCPTIPAGARVGDAIAYTVTIENTGDTTLTGIVVTDSRTGTFDSAFPTTLAPGSDPVSRTFTSRITAADAVNGDVDNTASVDSNQTALTSDTAECPFTPVSSLTVDKTCPTIPAGTRIGATITYTVTITNTGDTALSGLDVTESRPGTFTPAVPTTLAAGANYTGTFASALTAADVAAASVNNTISVDTDQTAAVEDSANCPFTPVTGLTIDKSCPTIAAGARIGASISYSVTVSNTGDTTLTSLVVTDSRAGTWSAAWPTSLAAATSATRVFTSTITAADVAAGNVNNTASVDSDQTALVSDTAECPFVPVSGIDIEKSCPTLATGARIGASISYSVTVTNTGDTTLTGLTVTDTRAGSFDSAFPASLAVGDSATRVFTSTITAADAAAGNVNNSATATATSTVGAVASVKTDTDIAECPFTPVTGVDITKTCPTVAAGARVGASVTYSVTITNTGDLPLTNVSFSDVRTGSLSAPFPTTLAVGGSATRVFTSTITAADAANGNVDNGASVIANIGSSQATVTDEVNVDCPFNPVEGIEISKTCPTIPADARAGDSIEYDVTIENTGDVTITGIVVTDDRAGSFDSPFPTTLAAGDTETRTFTSTITLADAANENVDNTASVSGSAGTVALSDQFTARCPFNPLSGIEITKSCPTIAAGARVGDEIAYEVTIENIGDTVLTGIVVSDTRAGSFDSAFPTTLDPGDTATRTFSSTITLSDAEDGNVNNSVSVTANVGALSAGLPAGVHAFGVTAPQPTTVSDTATASCPFNPVKGVDIEKSCPTVAAGARVGDEVTYSVTLRNTGDIVLTGVVVTDDREGSFDSPFPVALAPGQAETRTFTSQITADDAASGTLDNTVTVNTTQAVSDTDIVDCSFAPVTGLVIQKTCPTLAGSVRVGSAISYQVRIRNTGDVALANVAVSDSRDGSFDSAFPTSLVAGQEVSRRFTSTITLADAAAGNVDNTASVSATVGESDVELADSADADCPFTPVTGIAITKSCPTIAEGARVGDEITYEVTITNAGDVVLNTIVVTDTRDGEFDSAFPATLAPGASATRTFMSTITTDDAANGNVDNSATVTANVGDSEVEVTDTAEAGCAFIPVASVEIEKSCPTLAEGARVGDEITYDVTVTNTGDMLLSIVDVSDTREGSFDGPFPDELAPGESATRTFTSTITADDVLGENVDNSATVIVGIGESDIELTATADAECPFVPVGGIEITKTCPVLKSGPKLGDSIAYEVVITNTGDTALMIFEVVDSREGEWNEAFPEGLAPGESVTRTFTSTITADDLMYGNVDNEVTVTAMPFPPGDEGTPEPTQVTMVSSNTTNGVHAFLQVDEETVFTATAVADCPVEIPKETPTPAPSPTPTPPSTPVTTLPVTGQGAGAASAASLTIVLALVAAILMAAAGYRVRADTRRHR